MPAPINSDGRIGDYAHISDAVGVAGHLRDANQNASAGHKQFGVHLTYETQSKYDADGETAIAALNTSHQVPPADQSDGGHRMVVHHIANASSDSDQRDQRRCELQGGPAALIADLRENYKLRVDYHRTEKALTLRIKAQCRRLCGGDKEEAGKLYDAAMQLWKPSKRAKPKEHPLALAAFSIGRTLIDARAMIETQRKHYERLISDAAEQLPVWQWAKDIRGFGSLSLAQIIGETGDLSNYDTVSKVWKRMGLAVIAGERQQKKAGAVALLHGYAPSRRAVVWAIGDVLIKAGGQYKTIYDAMKADEVAKAEAAGLRVLPAAKIKPADKDKCRSQGHIHNRAKRRMEKRLIADLWSAWRRA